MDDSRLVVEAANQDGQTIMDSLEVSKILGAGCVALLVYVGMTEIAGAVYSGHKLSEPAYSVEEPEVATGPAEAPVPISALLQTADLAAGEKSFAKCKSCHTISSDGKDSTGPGLWGVVGRSIGAHSGFAYSDAIKGKSAEHWDWDHLDAFLASPRNYAPGTKMAFAGIPKGQERANLIAWLNSQSGAALPLPPPPAAGAEEAAPAEAPAPAPTEH